MMDDKTPMEKHFSDSNYKPAKRETYLLEMDVVEAARAWLVLVKNPDAGVYDGDAELEAAVEALERAEVE
jgi:hypothetical protein